MTPPSPRQFLVRAPNGQWTSFSSAAPAWTYAVAILGTLWIANGKLVQVPVKEISK